MITLRKIFVIICIIGVLGLLIFTTTPWFIPHVRVSKCGGQLYMTDWLWGFQTRHKSVISLIEECDRRYGLPNFPTFVIFCGDGCSRDVLGTGCFSSCSSNTMRTVMVPDFVFDSWPQVGIMNFDDECAKIRRAGSKPPMT